MQIYQHKNHPDYKVILKKLVNYTTGIYIRVDDSGKPMRRKKLMCHGFDEYTLVIKHKNLHAI